MWILDTLRAHDDQHSESGIVLYEDRKWRFSGKKQFEKAWSYVNVISKMLIKHVIGQHLSQAKLKFKVPVNWIVL